jgi:DNA-binding winged helix-turn-helix (wHTH) protein
MERNSEDKPVLVGQAGPLNGQRWMVQSQLIVGRDVTCDIMIPSRQVSRKHARFQYTQDGVYVEDLGSKNGTHINGSQVNTPILLKDGDVIQIAFAQQFVFLSSDATLPLEFNLPSPGITVHHGLLRVDKKSRRVWISTQEIDPPLSAAQFQLLEMLYDNEGEVVPRKDIIAKIWGAENALEVSEQAFDALVRRLRDRLANIDPKHQFIITVRGHGLRLDNPPEHP